MNSGFPGLLGFGDPILLNQSSNFNPSTNQSSTQNQHSIFNYFNPSSNYQSDRKIKVKRTRQRVDAGQPRNTYSTVPGQNHQMRSAIPTGKAGPPYLSNHNGPSDVISDFNQANFFGTTNSGWSNGSYPSQNNLTMDRMISQMIGNSLATQIRPGSVPVSAGVPHHAYPPVNGSSTLMSGNNMQMAQLLRFQAIMASNAAAEIKQNMAVKTEHQLVDCEPPMQSTATDLSVKTWHRNTPTPALSTESVTDSGSHLCSTSTTSSPDRKMDLKTPLDWGKTSSSNSSTVSHKSKRKQYLPQPTPQMDSERDFDPEIEEYDDVDLSCDDLITDSGDSPLKKRKRNVQDTSPSGLESPDDLELKAMQQEIVMMQQRFAQLLKARGQCETPPGLNISPSRNMKMLKNEVDDEPNTPENDRKPGEMKSLGHHLRRELTTNVESTVDNVLSQNLGMVERARSSYIAVQQTAIQMQQQASMAPNQTPYREWAQSQKNLYLNYCIALTSYANAASGLNSLGSAAAQSTKSNGIFPKGPVVHQAGLLGHAPFAPPPSSTGGGLGAFPASTSSYSHPTTHDGNIAALPLLVKKRRSKVTDSRISKVSATGAPYPFQASPLSLEESFRQTGFDRTFQAPPSMVPSGVISSPHSTGHGMELDGLVNSPRSNSDGTGSEIGNCYHEQLTSTLTPIHLRKAKLMFFYVRYPSSQILKAFFPDILFDKNNTAQLVKWFSNFREFYYIQMEKYARQALAEGIRSSDEITVNVDSELYRVLNVHYNRNNHIQVQVPTHFREVVEATLREFFKSLQANRDAEQAWKKTIYKIIARLDQTVPEYFKTTSFMEQLGFPDQ